MSHISPLGRLSWRPRELPAAEDVQVKVEDALARSGPIVGHNPKVDETFFLRDGRGGDHEMAEDSLVLGGCGTKADEPIPLLRDEQDVRGCHWVDVPKGVAQIILVDLVARDSAREDRVKDGARVLVTRARATDRVPAPLGVPRREA